MVFLSLARHLPASGVEPILVCMRPGPLAARARDMGIESYEFIEHRYRETLKVVSGIRWLAALTRHAKADLLHSNHMGHLYAGPASLITRVPELWHLHDYPYQPDMMDRLSWLIPSDYVVFTTNRVKSGFPGLHARPHSIIYPICIEPERLRAMPEQVGTRSRYGLGDGPLFVTVARLQAHKGHRYLLDAVPSVLAERPDAQFAIVGKADGAEQEKYRDDLLGQCSSLGVEGQVKFLGYVSDADLVALYREAGALVHPATSEGFGLTLLEAMALGTPIIAAASDGPSELLTHEKTGLLTPTAESGALAAAMVRLLKDHTLAERLKSAGAAHAATFRVDDMIAQTNAVYGDIITDRRVKLR